MIRNTTLLIVALALQAQAAVSFRAGRDLVIQPTPSEAAPSSIAVADFNGDGHLDQAVTGDAGLIYILLGKAKEDFNRPGPSSWASTRYPHP
jgi:hypothetical protein